MSTLMIPDSLKQALRSRYQSLSEDNGQFWESEKDHEWTVGYSYSEWSGYHDESDYFSCSTTILDHEPALPDMQEWYRAEMLPQNKEAFEKRYQEYHIASMYEIHKSCGYPEYYYKTILKLDCPDPDYHCTRPLWVMVESNKSR